MPWQQFTWSPDSSSRGGNNSSSRWSPDSSSLEVLTAVHGEVLTADLGDVRTAVRGKALATADGRSLSASDREALYTFTPLSVILTTFQGHSSIRLLLEFQVVYFKQFVYDLLWMICWVHRLVVVVHVHKAFYWLWYWCFFMSRQESYHFLLIFSDTFFPGGLAVFE